MLLASGAEKLMAAPGLADESCQGAVDALAATNGNKKQAAERLGLPYKTYASRLQIAQGRGFVAGTGKPFEVADLPEGDEPIEELLERRLKAFARKDKAERARKLIDVKVRCDGPIGIVHFGDPHVDDDGCDLPALMRHVEIVNRTEGMFGANVGDLQNNWVGRLAHLWGQQETSKRTAWRLTEWLVGSVQWLYLVGGNHDAWSGEGDPLKWMMRDQAGVFDYDGIRLNLPRGRSNLAQGPCRGARLRFRDRRAAGIRPADRAGPGPRADRAPLIHPPTEPSSVGSFGTTTSPRPSRASRAARAATKRALRKSAWRHTPSKATPMLTAMFAPKALAITSTTSTGSDILFLRGWGGGGPLSFRPRPAPTIAPQRLRPARGNQPPNQVPRFGRDKH